MTLSIPKPMPATAAPERSSSKVVLITGAAKRLGRHMALHLASQGWSIALHYNQSLEAAQQTASDIRALGAVVHLFQADLRQEPATASLIPQVVEKWGDLHAVINNASLFEYDNIQTVTYDNLSRHWQANTAPALILAREFHRHLLAKSNTGCLINLLDQKLWNPNPDYLSYTLSKAALQTANTLLAQALAPQLRVVAIAPGVTLPSGPMDETNFQTSHRMTPLQRSSTPDDIAQAISYALAAQAVTGTTLLVDGGQHLMAQPRDVMFLAQPATSTFHQPT